MAAVVSCVWGLVELKEGQEMAAAGMGQVERVEASICAVGQHGGLWIRGPCEPERAAMRPERYSW